MQPGHAPTLGVFSGRTIFDLYAADPGWFLAGNGVVCEVVLGDGRVLRAAVMLPGTP